MTKLFLNHVSRCTTKELIQFPGGPLAASSSVLSQLKPSALLIRATWMWATKTTPKAGRCKLDARNRCICAGEMKTDSCVENYHFYRET